MRRVLAVVTLIALAGCGGGGTPATGQPGQSSGTVATITPGQTGAAATQAPPATQSAGGTTALPAGCAAGFIAYLKLIEPEAARFDPATATLKDFDTVDRAVHEKSIEALNNPATLYDCSSVGLEFAYFDAGTPWDTVLQVASAEAPGTVDYFTTVRRKSASVVGKMADYGATSCEDAVARIQRGVQDATESGAGDVGDMTLDDGLALLGLYDTYLHEVQNGACPADKLGNDEFEFFGTF